MFFFFITLLSLLGRRPIGDCAAISRGPVPDRSATSCIKSQRGPHEVADKSPISRQPVPDQSPTSRRRVAEQLQNLAATPLRPLRSLWILVAERSQSGCSVYLTGALCMKEGPRPPSSSAPSTLFWHCVEIEEIIKRIQRNINTIWHPPHFLPLFVFIIIINFFFAYWTLR